MCEEMIKLRKWLDEHGIEWRDDSYTYDDDFFIHRTKFTVGDRDFSVINGRGTYGGFNSMSSYNQGLLEMWINEKGEPTGFLTAEDVIAKVGEEK